MPEPTITHSTFVVERSFPANPEKVFEAFSDPEKKRLWYAESNGQPPKKFTMDFRVGGVDTTTSIMGDQTPFPGTLLTNRTVYQDIVPDRRIVFAYTMALGERRFSASLATVELLANEQGTTLIFTDQGAYFEGSDGPQLRQVGWSSLLDSLGKKLEA